VSDESVAGPLVSVVVPCLNRAHLLRPTLDSILGQDYARIECIVADGGSTDGTRELLHGYGQRIRWISEPDAGHADAINKGWRMSRGQVLAWLNADDLWVTPDAVSRAVAYLAQHPEVDLVYGDCEAIDMEGRFLAMSYGREWDLEHAVLHCDYCIPQPTSFIRRGVLERVGFLDASFVSKKDHELWLRIGLVGTIRRIPVTLARERIGPGYLAQRGDITASACIALTRKFFTLPGVPQGLRLKRRRSLSNAHLEAMKWAFECGRHWRSVFGHAFRAAAIDPGNAGNALTRLEAYLAADAAPKGGLCWTRRALRAANRMARGLGSLARRAKAAVRSTG
jgi:glycosyltransferase involved in cell wall biosynthesis